MDTFQVGRKEPLSFAALELFCFLLRAFHPALVRMLTGLAVGGNLLPRITMDSGSACAHRMNLSAVSVSVLLPYLLWEL